MGITSLCKGFGNEFVDGALGVGSHDGTQTLTAAVEQQRGDDFDLFALGKNFRTNAIATNISDTIIFAKLTFGLDIYASGQNGGTQCQTAFDRLADLLHGGVLPGLRLESLSREETVYDRELGLFRCPVQAVCDAYLYAVADEDGVFMDFEVRGGRTNE